MLTSCNSDSFMMGNNYLDSEVRAVLIDTCTVRMTTVPIDSVATSGKNLLLMGSYSDTTQGKLKCTSYISFAAPSSQTFPVRDAALHFDSLELRFRLNGTFMGDTTKYHKFYIHRLSNVIEVPENEKFYSNWSRPYDATPLTSFKFKPKPKGGEFIGVRLPDAMGADIFQKILDDDETIVDNVDGFLEYFKGFALTGEDGNNAILGAQLNDSSMVLRIHYHYSTYQKFTGKIDIKPKADRCFYGLKADRTGTIFEDLKTEEMPSAKTGHCVLVQALTASYVKIEIPYLNKILELGDFGAIVDAHLYFYPVYGTYSDAVPLPKDLSMYISDENNVSVSAITTYSGDELQTGNLTVDDNFNENTYYSYDITSFLKDQLGAFGIYSRNLQLIVPNSSLPTTLTTLVAGDSDHPKNRVKLKISYIIYDGK